MPSPYETNVRSHLLAYLAAGHTQRSLADAMGVTNVAVNGWATGRNGPSLDCLVALAAALNLSLDTLILTAVPMPTPRHKLPTAQPLAANKPAPKRPPAHLHQSADADVARVPYQSYAPSVARKPLGSGAYSAIVVGVHGKEQVERMLRQ